MRRRHLYAVLLLEILGLSLLVGGIILWNERLEGNIIENWIQSSTIILPHSNKWTWGVGGDPSQKPDMWHFHVYFGSNNTSSLQLMWNLNQTTLFESNSSKVDQDIDISLPATNTEWRWDWVITNTLGSAILIRNFTIVHYPVTFPSRLMGEFFLVTAVMIIVAPAILVAYSIKTHKMPTRPQP